MAAFEYVALDGDGRTRRGVLNGDSARQVRSRMRNLGLHPVEVRAVKEDNPKQTLFSPGRRISATALAPAHPTACDPGARRDAAG